MGKPSTSSRAQQYFPNIAVCQLRLGLCITHWGAVAGLLHAPLPQARRRSAGGRCDGSAAGSQPDTRLAGWWCAQPYPARGHQGPGCAPREWRRVSAGPGRRRRQALPTWTIRVCRGRSPVLFPILVHSKLLWGSWEQSVPFVWPPHVEMWMLRSEFWFSPWTYFLLLL